MDTKKRYFLAIILGLIILSSSVFAVSSRQTISKVRMRGSGGDLEVEDISLAVDKNALRVDVVKRGDICYSSLNFVSKAHAKNEKVFLKVRLSKRDGCEITGDKIYFEGEAAVSYRTFPKVIRRPTVNSRGRIIWTRDIVGESRKISKKMPITFDYDGENARLIAHESFFLLDNIEIDTFDLRIY